MIYTNNRNEKDCVGNGLLLKHPSKGLHNEVLNTKIVYVGQNIIWDDNAFNCYRYH